MKFLPSQLLYFFHIREAKRNIRLLAKFLSVILLTVILYSVLFHFIMEYEGRQFTWITGLYWTLTVMSTLGFGDITFTSDLGLVFSIIVLLTGIVFLLVMLPFTFIRFFYAPWLEAQAQARTPHELPDDTSGHVIITNYDSVASSLIEKLIQYNFRYVIVLPDQKKALELHDMNFDVVVGDLDRIETYNRLQVENAALVVVNNDDMTNSNIISTIRELSLKVPIVTNADADDSIDILQLAGATHVFQFTRMLGEALARRALRISTQANIIGNFDQLLIAEAPAMRTPFEGKTLIESQLRKTTGLTVVGIWERGKFEIPLPKTLINSTSVLVLAGSKEQFEKYDELTGGSLLSSAHVLILGGGRVGRYAAQALKERGIEYRIVEKYKHLMDDNDERFILGNAADINILKQAGIDEVPTVFITTHDDATNIYLTIYCRKLRPDVQIISRANLDRNINTLHASGADLVMSYVSLGTNSIINVLKPGEILMLAEGLDIFRFAVPPEFVNKLLYETDIRENTGCNVVAIRSDETMNINPDPSVRLSKNDELILVGTEEAEKIFMQRYSSDRSG
jgi:Trk K+ transport system NAD-binding subunit